MSRNSRKPPPSNEPLFGDYSAGQLLEDEIPRLSVRRPTATQPDESVAEPSAETSNSDAIGDGSVSDEAANSAAAAELSDTKNTDATPNNSTPAAPAPTERTNPAPVLSGQTQESTVNDDEPEQAADAPVDAGGAALMTEHVPEPKPEPKPEAKAIGKKTGRARSNKDAGSPAPESNAGSNQPSGHSITMVDPAQLDVPDWLNELSPATSADDLLSIRESIGRHGIQVPPVARRVGERLELVDGRTRIQTAIDLSFHEVLVIVHNDLDDTTAKLLAITSNLARRQMTVAQRAELAVRYKKLLAVGQGRRTDLGPPSSVAKVDARTAAAEAAGVSASIVSDMETVLERGTDEQKTAVRSGSCGIAAIAKEVRKAQPARRPRKSVDGPDLKQLQHAIAKFEKAATALDQTERELHDLLDHHDWHQVESSELEDALDDVRRNARASELLRRLIDQLLTHDNDEADVAV